MECTIRWSGAGMSFIAETGSNHILAMDGAADGGGRNLAPRPMETVLAGTGGCTAYDVGVILKKSGQDVTGCEARLEAERAATDPKVFTRIHAHFLVRGRNLKRNVVEQAIRLSHEKYCSATAMLAKTADEPGRCAQRARAPDPERMEQPRPPAERADPVHAPGEVIALLARRALERRPRLLVARRHGLPLVQRLRADLAHVIDAHQRGGMRACRCIEIHAGKAFGGARPFGLVHAGDGAQGAI